MICGRRIRDHRKSAVRPVELPRLDDRPTDARAMAADEFRRRMQDDVGAPFDRAAEVRRRERVVHDQRQFVIVRDGGNRRDVEHVTGRVPDRLGVENLGVIAYGRFPRVRSVGIDPRQIHRHLAQHVLELIDRSPVQRR